MNFSRGFELETYKMKANRFAAILLTNQRAVFTENVKSRFIIQHLFPSLAKTILNSIGTMRLPQRIQTTTMMITTMKILILKQSHYK